MMHHEGVESRIGNLRQKGQALDKKKIAVLGGGMAGLVATYELANKAVLADWPWPIVPIDILWGGILCTACSWVGWRVGQF